MPCPRCGGENPAGSQTCSHCGTALQPHAPASPAEESPVHGTDVPAAASAAPTAAGARSKRGRGGLIALIAVALVAVIGLVGGLYYHTRLAPRKVAEAYLAASQANDVDALRGLLTRAAARQLPTKEEADEARRRMEEAFPESAELMRQLEENIEQEVKAISAGLNEARAEVEVRISAFGQQTTRSYTIFLAREGIEWKVDLERTGQEVLNPSRAE